MWNIFFFKGLSLYLNVLFIFIITKLIIVLLIGSFRYFVGSYLKLIENKHIYIYKVKVPFKDNENLNKR